MPLAPAGTVYATVQDLQDIGMLGAALQTIPLAAQEKSLASFSRVIDTYLSSQYVLPLQQWDMDIVHATCVLAAWDLLAARGYSPQAQTDINLRQRYLDILAWLEKVSEGELTPANVIDSSTPTGEGDGSEVFTFDGGYLVTTDVRGWTDRGVRTPDKNPVNPFGMGP